MQRPPPPQADESADAGAPHDLTLVGSSPEPLFDNLARMAAEACAKPIALIVLIDRGRPELKASIGWPGAHEMPRDAAFCAHAVLQDDVFEVPDAGLDPRFAGHPLVTALPGIRFYAGAPLRLPGGARAGTLCVMDRLAGRLDEARARGLRALAGLVSDALVMRRGMPVGGWQAELQREHALRLQIESHANALDKLLRERDEMIQVLAHEVRQPLNNASAALQSASALLLEKGEKAASLRLTRAQTVMSQVLASIDNTLAVASLLARQGQAEGADTDIDTLVAVVLGDLPAAERHRVRVRRDATSRTVFADMSLLRLALRNLLLNALTCGPPEAPVVVRLIDSDDPLALLIDVEDAGSGFDAALLPRLFERGTRGKRSSGPPGHGLGLYIVRRVMELHGGRVELVRNTPQGSTMRLVVVSPSDTRMGELGPA